MPSPSLRPGGMSEVPGDGLGSVSLGRLVRGQYEGYRDEEGVGPFSATDTFAMAVLRMRGGVMGESDDGNGNVSVSVNADERSSDATVDDGTVDDGDGGVSSSADVGLHDVDQDDANDGGSNDDDDGEGGVHRLGGRWVGVPMVLVAGKGMDRREASVRVEYRANLTPTTATNATAVNTASTRDSSSATTATTDVGGANMNDDDSNRGSSSSAVLQEVLGVVDEVKREVARLQALRRGGESPTTYFSPSPSSSPAPTVLNDSATAIMNKSDERVCVGLALVLQIQPQPGLYIERQYDQKQQQVQEQGRGWQSFPSDGQIATTSVAAADVKTTASVSASSSVTVVTERELLLSLADLLSCPLHDPLGRALQVNTNH